MHKPIDNYLLGPYLITYVPIFCLQINESFLTLMADKCFIAEADNTFFIYLFLDEHFHCLYVLDIVNNSAI